MVNIKINILRCCTVSKISIYTCFVRLWAHHHEKQLCLCDIWYCLVYRSICSCIPDTHPYRITSTKCHINSVISSDDGHIIARNMYQGADKSLARPGRKQDRKHVRDARDFNNIETRAVIKFFFFPCTARRRRKFTQF